MKKITSQEPISFRVDGNTFLEIDKKGCLAEDVAAAMAQERLGDHITVENVSVKEAAETAKKELEEGIPKGVGSSKKDEKPKDK